MGLISAHYKEHPPDFRSFGVTKVTLPLKHPKYFGKYFENLPEKNSRTALRKAKPGLHKRLTTK